MTATKILAVWFMFLLISGCGTFAGTDLAGDDDDGKSNSSGTKYEIEITESNGLYLKDDHDDRDHPNDLGKDNGKSNGKGRDGDQSRGKSANANSKSDHDSVEDLDGDDVKMCGDLHGDDLDIVKVTGSKQTVEISKGEVLAVRITGNQNTVNVSIKPVEDDGDDNDDEKPTMAAMCFFLAGNSAAANIELDNFVLESFSWTARGNSSETALAVGSGAKVSEILTNARGNGARLSISGEGDYTCPDDSDVKGNASEIECSK